MSRISSSSSSGVRSLFANRCLAAGILAINAASAATLRTTNAIPYTIDGIFRSKTALAAQSFAPTHRFNGDPVAAADPAYVQPANTTVIYVIAVNAAGTVAVIQGSFQDQVIRFSADLSKVLTGNGAVPVEPTGYTAIGAVKVVTGPVTFTPGTTALDAANVTATYFDLAHLPESL